MKVAKNIVFIISITFINFISPSCVFAQINIGSAFRFNDKGVQEVFGSLSVLINALLSNIFIITGIIFLVLLIFAGLGVILSSGSGNPEGAKKAKSAATAAAIGLFLVIASYWLIQIIEYLTGIKIFNPNI